MRDPISSSLSADHTNCSVEHLWTRSKVYLLMRILLAPIAQMVAADAEKPAWKSTVTSQCDLNIWQIEEDYQDIPLKADRMKAIRQDQFFNALQVKFAYAVTCHKAQGGQWAHVYVDQGYMTDDMLTPDYIHWLYTAFTRATEKLYLVNWPETQTATS